MDVQMLLAANNKELKRYTEAEQHLKTAATMCPARFMPLYELVKLYEIADRKKEALALAKHIIDKDVKIPSRTVEAIKLEMRLGSCYCPHCQKIQFPNRKFKKTPFTSLSHLPTLRKFLLLGRLCLRRYWRRRGKRGLKER